VCAELLQKHAIKSPMVLAHIRLATQGAPALKNTQPFVRELAGRTHTFAHNGRLDGIEDSIALGGDRFHPVGETDSEHAFCVLLHRLGSLWASGAVPGLPDRYALVRSFAREISQLGPANFMYSDGDVLFVHSHKRKQLSGELEAPGLHLLYRACDYGHRPLDTKAVKVQDGQTEQAVALIASVPLSDEAWEPLAEGAVLAFRAGKLVSFQNGLR
jgi:glutamine amidotransferase